MNNKTITANKNAMNRSLADASLLFAALIWGSGFIATQMAIDSGMSFGLIMAIRFVSAAAILAGVFRKKLKRFTAQEIKYGCTAGALLFSAFYAQTVGLSFTTPSNNAFFTSTNVMLVPFLSWFFIKQRPELKSFICGGLCLAGMAVLSVNPTEGFRLNPGDLITLVSAFLFAGHIVSLGIGNAKMDYYKLTFLQIGFAAVLSLVAFLVLDIRSFEIDSLAKGWQSALYLGVFSTCIAFFINTRALKFTSPARASIIISTESVFGSLFSILLGYESLTAGLAVGGALILSSVVLTELNINNKKRGVDA